MNPVFTRATTLLAAAMLAACAATPPPPATLVQAARFSQAVVPGQTTKAELLAALGPTRSVVFEGLMLRDRRAPSTHSPAIRFLNIEVSLQPGMGGWRPSTERPAGLSRP